jgi:hypothetical protein
MAVQVVNPRRTNKHIVRRVMIVLAALVVLAGAALVAQIRYPHLDAVQKADAIVVLGEPDVPALARAQQLLDSGVSDNLLLIIPFGAPPQCGAPPAGVHVFCVIPDPLTTRGDARAIREIAGRHHWNRLVVVTWTSHVSRSRTLIDRCFKGTVMMTSYPTGYSTADWLKEFAHQTAGYVKVAAAPTC